MDKTTGLAISEDEWTVNCPRCEKEYHYEGFLDPNDVTECECGCEFTTMYLEDEDGNRYE